MRWRFKSWPEGHHSNVTLELEQKPDGTELRLKQTGIPANSLDQTQEGWQNYYWKSIKQTFGFGTFFYWYITSLINLHSSTFLRLADLEIITDEISLLKIKISYCIFSLCLRGCVMASVRTESLYRPNGKTYSFWKSKMAAGGHLRYIKIAIISHLVGRSMQFLVLGWGFQVRPT